MLVMRSQGYSCLLLNLQLVFLYFLSIFAFKRNMKKEKKDKQTNENITFLSFLNRQKNYAELIIMSVVLKRTIRWNVNSRQQGQNGELIISTPYFRKHLVLNWSNMGFVLKSSISMELTALFDLICVWRISVFWCYWKRSYLGKILLRPKCELKKIDCPQNWPKCCIID